MDSITSFIKRNRKRNAHLYSDGLLEGFDYVICPISGERLSMIKDNYIQNVLQMKIEDYPNIQRICKKRNENIKVGLKQIDPQTGLSKYEAGQVKARKTLAKVDANGKRGYDRKGQRTRATHLSKIDEFGRNGYKRQANARLTTILPNGLTIEQNAHLKQKESLIKNHISGTGGASKLSKKVLQPILKLLEVNCIKYYFDKTEYGIKDPDSGQYYFWDLTIPEYNLTIEYQSSAWHANPTLPEDKWQKWIPPRGKKISADNVLQYDYTKARSLYKHRKFITYYVWQETQESDVENIICLLKTLNTKS